MLEFTLQREGSDTHRSVNSNSRFQFRHLCRLTLRVTRPGFHSTLSNFRVQHPPTDESPVSLTTDGDPCAAFCPLCCR
jgi:hypothetical protein